ncbi:MAG: hypothetical protein WCD79_02390 [Chthoniobacteraceae bacterium]
MKRSTIISLVLAVVAVHLCVFWLVCDFHILPKREVIPPPNFSAQAGSTIIPATGEKIIVHEYTVSTKLLKQSTPAQ